MALIVYSTSYDLSHALYYEHIHYRARTLAKQGQIKRGPRLVIQYDQYMALTASFGSCDLYHTLWCENNSLQGPHTGQTGSILEDASKKTLAS